MKRYDILFHKCLRKRGLPASLAIIYAAFIVCSCCMPQKGFKFIFNGKNLNQWDGDSTYWRVENGELVGEVTPSTLLKRNSFIIWRGGVTRDFELKLEFKVSEHGNSGINYRSEEIEGIPFALKGYQADLDGQLLYTGSNYEERGRTTLASRGEKVIVPDVEGLNKDSVYKYSKNNFWTKTNVIKSLGNKDALALKIKKNDWNEYDLIVKGNHLQHYVNGILMSDVTDNDIINRKSEGLLGVQVHVGPPMKIEFRNLRLKEYKEKHRH